MMVWIRSALYWLGVLLTTPVFFIIALAVLPLPRRPRHWIVTRWTHIMLAWLKLTCGLRFRVVGAENIPNTPSIVASKHQSGWETMALQQIFPAQVWVLKRELLMLPFFGWALATTSPIAIDRKRGLRASQQLVQQGRDRLECGFWIVVFPEGTRTQPGQRIKYKQGAAKMAIDLNVPLVPVAHNAGEFWPKNAFCKYPGEITVVVGAPVVPDGRSTADISREIEEWIEAQQLTISGVGPFASEADRARRLATHPH